MRNVAILGATKLGNRPWRPGKKVCSFAFLGTNELDFRQAEMEEGVTKVKAVSFLGAVSIVVPKDMQVTLSGFSLLGAREVQRSKEPQATVSSSKTLHVNAISILGAVEVTEESEDDKKAKKG